jgi:hypothetical protein
MPIEAVSTPKGEKISVVWEENYVVIKANGKPYNPFKDCKVSTNLHGEVTYNGDNLQSTVEEFLSEGWIMDEVKNDGMAQFIHEELIMQGVDVELV